MFSLEFILCASAGLATGDLIAKFLFKWTWSHFIGKAILTVLIFNFATLTINIFTSGPQ